MIGYSDNMVKYACAVFMVLPILLSGCATKYIARMEAEQELIRQNRQLIQEKFRLVEKISSTPLVSICENGKCITVNQHIDSSLLSATQIQSDFPDPDGAVKAAWGVVGNVLTTGVKVAAGAYIGHELADFATQAVKNAGHNTTTTLTNSGDGDMGASMGDGTVTIEKPSTQESYNQEIVEEEPVEEEVPEPVDETPDPVETPDPGSDDVPVVVE